MILDRVTIGFSATTGEVPPEKAPTPTWQKVVPILAILGVLGVVLAGKKK